MSPSAAPGPFGDLLAYTRLPRTSGLALSPDGTRLVTGTSLLDAKGGRSTASLWEVDPSGQRPARRLTRGAKGESSPVFTPRGDLLFTSSRPDPAAAEGEGDDDAPAALWCLPAGGGEARVVAVRPGGVTGVAVARASGAVLVGSPTLPSSADAADDARRRALRADTRTSGVLHDSLPVRVWDHDLGPDRVRLLVVEGVGTADGAGGGPLAGSGGAAGSGDDRLALRDLTGHVGPAVPDDPAWALTADGTTAVTEWRFPEARADHRVGLVAIDVATCERRTLLDDPRYEHVSPAPAPSGALVAALRWRRSSPTDPVDVGIVVVDTATGEQRELAQGWDRWPASLTWDADGAGLLVTADDGGRCPVFRVDLATGAVERLTPDDGAYTDVVASPDGRWLYALRSAVDAPPAPVRVPAAGGAPEPLPSPAHALGDGDLQLPGTLTEVAATAEDGSPLRAWLALPAGAGAASPAPLLLWIHGGPLNSWNAWSWRWNPWLAVARGYAVLLPDPALSTGYGRAFVARGWGRWGSEPFTDLLAVTDAAVARDDVDAERTAAMGGSFGGYMANWVAGHTDRFRAVVTHASLWALDQFAATTDFPAEWAHEMTAEMTREHSPHASADAITTPVLVIHGEQDDRVPIGEALRLWYDLLSRSQAPDGASPHRFLHFPDEGHWVLGAGNARLWYATVFAFLDQHVLGRPWTAPEELG